MNYRLSYYDTTLLSLHARALDLHVAACVIEAVVYAALALVV